MLAMSSSSNLMSISKYCESASHETPNPVSSVPLGTEHANFCTSRLLHFGCTTCCEVEDGTLTVHEYRSSFSELPPSRAMMTSLKMARELSLVCTLVSVPLKVALNSKGVVSVLPYDKNECSRGKRFIRSNSDALLWIVCTTTNNLNLVRLVCRQRIVSKRAVS